MIPKCEADLLYDIDVPTGTWTPIKWPKPVSKQEYDDLSKKILDLGPVKDLMREVISFMLRPPYKFYSEVYKKKLKDLRYNFKRYDEIEREDPDFIIKVDQLWSDIYECVLYEGMEDGSIRSLMPCIAFGDCPYTFEQCLDDEFYPE